MLKKMRLTDIQEVVNIHLSSWDPKTLSVKLGGKFLNHFYYQIVTSADAFGYVETKGEEIVGYATGFINYPAFDQRLTQNLKMKLIVGTRLLTGRLKLTDLLSGRESKYKYDYLSDPRFHLGALALRNKYKKTREGKKAITTAIDAVISRIKKLKASFVWASTDAQNIPMIRYLQKYGFIQINTLNSWGVTTLVFEKRLRK